VTWRNTPRASRAWHFSESLFTLRFDFLFAGLDGVAFFTVAYKSGKHLQLDSIGWRIWFAAPVLVSAPLIGRMLARWAPGRELAACVVYAVLVSTYNLVPMLGDNGGVTALLCILIVPAAAAWGRYRRLEAMHARPL